MSLRTASSSRLTPSLSSSLTFIRTKKTDGSARYVKRRAPKPRMQRIPDIHDPLIPTPYAGTKHPHPSHLGEHIPTTTSVDLGNSGLKFHHSPPASAPNYTFGTVPPLLSWLGGTSLRLTGEEQAPLVSHRKADFKIPDSFTAGKDWSEGIKAKIAEMRRRGKSVSQIGKTLSIAPFQRKLIPYVATATLPTLEKRQEALDRVKSQWGWNKRMWRAVRERRKDFW